MLPTLDPLQPRKKITQDSLEIIYFFYKDYKTFKLRLLVFGIENVCKCALLVSKSKITSFVTAGFLIIALKVKKIPIIIIF